LKSPQPKAPDPLPSRRGRGASAFLLTTSWFTSRAFPWRSLTFGTRAHTPPQATEAQGEEFKWRRTPNKHGQQHPQSAVKNCPGTRSKFPARIRLSNRCGIRPTSLSRYVSQLFQEYLPADHQETSLLSNPTRIVRRGAMRWDELIAKVKL
jgi:hypothetical protein